MRSGKPGKTLFVALLLFSLLSLGSAPFASPELDVSFNHDLIYLNIRTGNLMIWPVGQDTLEILAGVSSESRVQIDGSVVSYTASDSGHELALVIEHADKTYGIIWLSSQTLTVEAVGVFSSLPEVKISPNGSWIAYREQDSVEIFAVDMDEPGEKFIVGICNELENHWRTLNCTHFQWSPNSAQLAWSDGRGLWIAQPPGYGKQVANNFVLYNDGEKDVIGNYRRATWSPNSRYLVLSRSGGIEGTRYALLDAKTGSVVTLPRTFQHGDTLPLFVTWLDANLLSVNSRDGFFERGPGTNIWRIDPSSPELLVLENRYYFGMPCGLVSDSGLYDENGVFYVIRQVEREYCEEEVYQGLYFSSKLGSYPILALELPEDRYGFEHLLWSPDYEIAILKYWDIDRNAAWGMLDVGQGTIENLTGIIGASEDVCCFTWVE